MKMQDVYFLRVLATKLAYALIVAAVINQMFTGDIL